MPRVVVFWFRRDLRLVDNAGLYHALKAEHPVLPLFIFDRNILDDLEDKKDARVEFIHGEISKIKAGLERWGSSLIVKYGYPNDIFKQLLREYAIAGIYTNDDYEPYARKRDSEVAQLLQKHDIPFNTFKDQVIFEKDEVVKSNGEPYAVFTPYSKAWLEKLDSKKATYQNEDGDDEEISYFLKPYPAAGYYDNFYKIKKQPMPSLQAMGFETADIEIPPATVSRKRIKEYGDKRDYPAEEGTSRLGIHYRFGTISIRDKVRKARSLSEAYFNELIWRDFYAAILWHFPKVVHTAFRQKYDFIEWRNDEKEFEKWCQGKTGYPMVDAGMRQLNQSGYMHNRVRMITASFLTKHLLIDWRWGEAYFAKKLLDYELSSNNGGWQWAAGTGTDAAPYFRIFNPITQQEKYDPDEKYIKEWIPEYGTGEYPDRMVEHKAARQRCLNAYKVALDKAQREK